jgi:hypothetical protein
MIGTLAHRVNRRDRRPHGFGRDPFAGALAVQAIIADTYN